MKMRDKRHLGYNFTIISLLAFVLIAFVPWSSVWAKKTDEQNKIKSSDFVLENSYRYLPFELSASSSNLQYINKDEVQQVDYRTYRSIYSYRYHTALATFHFPEHSRIRFKAVDAVTFEANNLYFDLKAILKVNSDRPRQFQTDSRLPPSHQIFQGDYKNSLGYSRGHLVPAGDFMDDNEKRLTFRTTNLAPQMQETFNEQLWNTLESCIRYWNRENGDHELYVITGVIHLEKSAERILLSGSHGSISVPEYFYKIIVDLEKKPYRAQAYLMENRRYDLPEEHGLDRYRISVSDLEKLSGFKFFSNWSQQEKDMLDSSVLYDFEQCPADY